MGVPAPLPQPYLVLPNEEIAGVGVETQLLSGSVLKVSPGAGCALTKPKLFSRSDGRVVTLEFGFQGVDPASRVAEWVSLPAVNPTVTLGLGHTRLFIRARDGVATSTAVGPFLFNVVGTLSSCTWAFVGPPLHDIILLPCTRSPASQSPFHPRPHCSFRAESLGVLAPRSR